MKYSVFAYGALCLLWVVACAPSAPAPAPLPTPTVATLSPDKGAVTGLVLAQVGAELQPAPKTIVYLAATVKDASGTEVFISFDRVNSPRTATDDKGRFVFWNIPPGRYGLIVDQISRSIPLSRLGADQLLIIEVSAGEQVDVGTLSYESPSRP
jgi:hypothetical protein